MKNDKGVIFVDFGGVYFENANPIIASKFSKKLKTTEKKVLAALFGANYTEYAEGRSDDKRYWKHVADVLNITEEHAEELRDEWYLHAKPQKEIVKLVRMLKNKKKYRVAALSSITPGWIEYLEGKHKISREFHELHYSYDHGVDKPNAEFFLSAAKKMNARPQDCIVIDDNKEFLDEVRKAGGKPILFMNARQARMELVKLGVEI